MSFERIHQLLKEADNIARMAEFNQMDNQARNRVDLVFEDTPQGCRLLKPRLSPYNARLIIEKICYVEFTEPHTKEDSRKYDREELIAELRCVAREIERTPTLDDVLEYGTISASPYYRVFDSFWDALAAAKLLPQDNAGGGNDAE